MQVGVIEVGMGGRLDATNVWQGGISAITNVELDHMEHLGPTIGAIAIEKSHIIKRGDSRAITGARDEALEIITARARRVGVPLRVVQPWPVAGMDGDATRVRAPDGLELRLGLLGCHQAVNASVAAAVIDALDAAGIAKVSGAQLARGFCGGALAGPPGAGTPSRIDRSCCSTAPITRTA